VTVSRPPEIGAGDEVRISDRAATVVAVTGTGVQLQDITGTRFTVTRGELLASPGFQVITARTAPLPPSGLLDGVPEEAAEKARWWERHIIEVLTGTSPGTAEPRTEYDPLVTTLRQRELAKVEELRSAGHQVALRTFQRMRLNYETGGLWELVDARLTRPSSPTGKADQKVVDAVRQAVREQTDASTGTVDRVRRRTEQILAEAGTDPAGVMPSRAGFYRLVKSVSEGKHTFGSARTRRSLAKQPAGPFGTVTAFRPGQWMQIDSSPLNIAVRLDNGLTDRAELTWIIDLATRSIPAAVLSPSTKAVDAALLLARCLTPEPMRPGWADALRMSRSVLLHRRLTGIDQRLADAAARQPAGTHDDAPALAPVRGHPARQLHPSSRAAVVRTGRHGPGSIRRPPDQLPLRDGRRRDVPGPRRCPPGTSPDPAEPQGDECPPHEILTGLQTTGKTTALKQLGRMHELRLREKHPGRAGDRIPVVYVSSPPKGSPRKLAAEFARFLGLPPVNRVYNTGDITDAVCEILIQAKVEPSWWTRSPQHSHGLLDPSCARLRFLRALDSAHVLPLVTVGQAVIGARRS
jgi:hypothetical protein